MADPKLTVRLETDAQGKPKFVEGTKRRHYRVVFEVEDAPPDAYAATFELDPSYYNPARTLLPISDGKFRFETTTYGDYPIVVRLRRSSGDEIVLKDSVARALRRARDATDAAPAQDVDAALSYIAQH